MPSKLGYWNCRGYGQPIRLMIAYVGEECEEKRYEFCPLPDYAKNWAPEKYTLDLDFPNLPYYNDGKVNLSQSHAIIRYLGIKHGLEPQTDEAKIRSALADEQMKDFREALVKVCANMAGEDRDTLTSKFFDEQLPPKLKEWDGFLGDRPWLAGDNICYADFGFYHYLSMHVLLREDLLKDYPNLAGYLQRFENLPKIKDYLQSDKLIKSPVLAPFAQLLGAEK